MNLYSSLYESYNDYIDVSIRVTRVSSGILGCPDVILECHCTCDEMMVYKSFFGRSMSLYWIMKNMSIIIDLVG